MKKAIFTLLISALSISAYAQNFEVPQNYKLVAKEDYAPYEQDIVNCVNWLAETPVNQETDKRQEANAFLFKWVSGSPNVHVELNDKVVTFIGTSPELLLVYLGGWAKRSITTKDYDNKIEGSLAGIESVIAFYTKNREHLPKDKAVEKYIKLKEKGELRDFIVKNS
ncbi:hypothetical protein H8S95_12540 [Pontibacter sp. KCTC 32443]|uniref:hypothetical protein n=1 Tax=Pontibacter TaxID=323449 RepID=UPI00164ECF13|nr:MULTISPECIES: hypothetical protein [Pontibacter]MBC5774896.1 hypothetical protein [Pontibacter sp. KCTC 32443]